MNKLKQRRKNFALCPRCKSPGYILLPPNKDIPREIRKPVFKCTCCNNIWSYGKDGGKYMENL